MLTDWDCAVAEPAGGVSGRARSAPWIGDAIGTAIEAALCVVGELRNGRQMTDELMAN